MTFEERDEFDDLPSDNPSAEDWNEEGNEEHLEAFCHNESLDYNDVSTKRALAFSVADAVKSGQSFTLSEPFL
jgi:hypothetical protein